MKRTGILIKKLITSLTVTAVTVSAVFNMEYGHAASKTGNYSVSGPRTETDGTVTWDKLTFGSYRQDAYIIKNPIKWRILSIDGDDAFLLADKVLDCKPMNTEKLEDITWEDCTLRGWLNSEFIDEAFSEEEQGDIKYTHVVTRYSQLYSKDENGDKIDDMVETDDRIYFLSEEELNKRKYGFAGYSDLHNKTEPRGTCATDYAYYIGKNYTDSHKYNNGKIGYWLRTMIGNGSGFDMECYGQGIGGNYEDAMVGVRPVLHISMSSSYIKPAGSVDSAGRTYTDSITESGYHSPVVIDDVSTWDCVYFGQYKDIYFERKPIEWRVLSVDAAGNALLLSDKSIDCIQYNTVSCDDLTWKDCSLREWLNDDFISTAFKDEERAAIVEQKLVSEDTMDKVFLPSRSDIVNEEYGFDGDFNNKRWVNNRAARITDYAYMKRQYRKKYNEPYPEAAEYWLRTTGSKTGYAYNIDWDGSGYSWSADNCFGVRPALLLNLNASVWEQAGTVNSTDIEQEMSSPKVYPTLRPDVTPCPTLAPVTTATPKPTLIPDRETASDEYTEIAHIDYETAPSQNYACSCRLSDLRIASIIINPKNGEVFTDNLFRAAIYDPSDNSYREYELESVMDSTEPDINIYDSFFGEAVKIYPSSVGGFLLYIPTRKGCLLELYDKEGKYIDSRKISIEINNAGYCIESMNEYKTGEAILQLSIRPEFEYLSECYRIIYDNSIYVYHFEAPQDASLANCVPMPDGSVIGVTDKNGSPGNYPVYRINGAEYEKLNIIDEGFYIHLRDGRYNNGLQYFIMHDDSVEVILYDSTGLSVVTLDADMNILGHRYIRETIYNNNIDTISINSIEEHGDYYELTFRCRVTGGENGSNESYRTGYFMIDKTGYTSYRYYCNNTEHETAFYNNIHWISDKEFVVVGDTGIRKLRFSDKHCHNWDDGVMVSQNTIYDEGVIEYTCRDCGGVIRQKYPRMYQDEEVENNKTAEDENIHTHIWEEEDISDQYHIATRYTCKICGYSYIDSVNRKNISDAKVVIQPAESTYNGSPVTPQVQVYYEGELLNNVTDYDIEYINNIDAGSATVKITGNGLYYGDNYNYFNINQSPFIPGIEDDILEVDYDTDSLSKIELPDGWAFVNPDTKLRVGENTEVYVRYYGFKHNYTSDYKYITVIRNEYKQAATAAPTSSASSDTPDAEPKATEEAKATSAPDEEPKATEVAKATSAPDAEPTPSAAAKATSAPDGISKSGNEGSSTGTSVSGFVHTGSNGDGVSVDSPIARIEKSSTAANRSASDKASTERRDYIRYKNNIYLKCGKKKASYVKPVSVNIKSITIPDTIKYKGMVYKVTSIEKKACYGLKKLKNVMVGNNVSVVGEKAFSGCNSLTRIVFGKRIKKLEAAVLSGDSSLKTIKFKSMRITSFGRRTFRGVPVKVDILIPVAMAGRYAGMIKKAK